MTPYIVFVSIVGLVPLVFIWPHVGLLLWFWVGLMNPHRLIWGPLESFSYAAVIGGATLLAWVVSRESKRIPVTPVTVMLGLFLVWITVTSLTARLPGEVWSSWDQAFKIMLITFVSIALINTRERLHALIWIMVVSIGFYGLKGGVFTVLSGGEYRVWGPPQTFIGDNNQLALALIMTLPFVVYLQQQSQLRWLRWALVGLGVMFVFSIIGSQSRGAFLAICVVAGFLVLKSPKRLPIGAAVLVLSAVAALFIPDRWVERMETIQNYEEDMSAQGRFQAWTFAYKVALDSPIVGGGFNVFLDEPYFFSLVPDAFKVWNFHSVYFEVLGEHGFVGLALFLGLLFAAWRTFARVGRLSRGRGDLAWAHTLARMGQVSLVGYASGGAFLNLAFYDLYYLIVAIAAIAHGLVVRELGAAPATRRAIRGNRAAGPAPAPTPTPGSGSAPSPAPARTAAANHASAAE